MINSSPRPTESRSPHSKRIRRWTVGATFAALSLAIFATPRFAVGSQAYGSINNFDCVNDTGVEAHGFDIEMDDVHSVDITYTYDWNHYGAPKITEDNSNPLHPKVLVRYAGTYASGIWSAYTAIPSGPISPTQGHQFTDPSVNFGGEHFGVGFTVSPTAVRYYWLTDAGGGNLQRGSLVTISTPTFNYAPPAGVVPAQVVAVVVPPPPPAPPVYQFGDASWVKAIKTTTHNANPVHLNDLVGDDPGQPQPWANGEAAEVETEWKILQTDFNAANGGVNGELDGAPEDLPNNDEVVTRRYEFYKYIGPIDAETGEAMADQVAADGIHGVGMVTYADHFDNNTGEWVTVTVDLSTVEVVGDFFGAQMAAFDASPNLGMIDNIQDGEENVQYPDRRVVIGGASPFTASITAGVLPLGLSLDPTTGVLSGTPTFSGAYTFTVTASDVDGGYAQKEYNMTIVGIGNPGVYTINTTSSPIAGGTTSGGGTFNSGDPVSLLAQPNAHWYFIDWSEGNAHFAFTPDYYFNASSNRNLVATFAQDTHAPTTTCQLDGVMGGLGWYTSSVNVSLPATDDLSGVSHTYYKLDNGATQTYGGVFAVSPDGAHTLNYWSVDAESNTEASHSQSISIDTVAPVVGETANPAKIWPANGKIVTVTISGQITDAASGVATSSGTYSTVDTYGLVEPSGTFLINSDGTYSFTIQVDSTRTKKDPTGRTYTVTVSALDIAGHSGSNSATILVPLRK